MKNKTEKVYWDNKYVSLKQFMKELFGEDYDSVCREMRNL